MNKFYLFESSAPIDKSYFEDALKSSGSAYEITYETPTDGYILADEKFFGILDGLLLPMHDDLGLTISVVAAHREGPLESKALKEAVSYFPNQVLFLSDVLMKEFSFGDYSSLPLLSAEFKGVSHELLLTAGTFLRVGLNASLAAEKLIIHRNTFNYRLNQFIDETGLDIRDYHNALLLEIYFQLGHPQ
jgi:hypothetical protein